MPNFSTTTVKAVSIAASVVLAAGIAGCASGATASSGANRDGTLNGRLITDPSGFDPALAKASDDYHVARLLFDTLLRKGDNGNLVGGLAQSWAAVDASTYELTLRSDLTCADGSPITATVVANSLSRVADPATGSIARTLTFGDGTASVTPDDARSTVRISLSEDWSDLLDGLTAPQTGIVCPAGLADPAGLRAGTVAEAFTGPYSLTRSSPAVSYEFTLRDNYSAWPQFEPPLAGAPPNRITLTPISDQTTVATHLLAGTLHTANLTDENVKRLTPEAGFTAQSVLSSTLYIVFNERPGTVFADAPDKRAAVARALDRVTFNDIVSGGRGEVLTSLGGPNLRCANTDESVLAEHDPAAAAKALGGVSINIVGTTALSAGNEYIAEMLRKAGADVTMNGVDSANWSSITRSGSNEWDLTLMGDANLVGTLSSSLLRVMGPSEENGGRNKSGVTNDEGYHALREAMSATDPAAHCAALQRAQRSALARVDAVPLATLPMSVVTTGGVSMRVFGDYADFATLRFED
ncbi:ABC transporter substrate-binding protein [Rhodococcus sp. NPDC003348]